MPLFDPRTPVELNAAKKLLQGAGTLSDIVGNLYNKYAPAPVKDVVDYWNNTPDPIPGPSPDDPLKMASIVVPWLLMRGGKTAAKAKKIVEKKFGVRDVEELMNIPYTRYQQETVDIPVSQGGRSGIFTTPSIGHTKADPDVYSNPYSGVEGGAHKVQGVATTKNPLFIDRDIRKYPDESHEYLGARVIKDLLGPREAEAITLALEYKNGGNSLVKQAFGPEIQRGHKIINSLFTPKERKMLYNAKAGNIAMEEAVANKLAQRAGYDSIINLRQFTKGWEPSEAVNTYVSKVYDKDPHMFPSYGKGSYTSSSINHDKFEKAMAQRQEDTENLRLWLGPGAGIYMPNPFRRLLLKAYKSKASPQLTREDLERLQKSVTFKKEGNLASNFGKALSNFVPSKSTRGYNATQMVLLDPALQKQGAKAINKLQIDELMSTPPEVLHLYSKYPNMMDYFKYNNKLNLLPKFQLLSEADKGIMETHLKKHGFIDAETFINLAEKIKSIQNK